MREIRVDGSTFVMSDRTYELVMEGARLNEAAALKLEEAVDVHESGQLRLGAAGDQLEVLPLEDEAIPVSEGPRLASPTLEDEQRFRDWLTRHGPGGTLA